jgi:hypothetical protein
MGALSAITQKLRFTTFVVKLPLRHPVLTAKQATSVAVLSDNRFGFGVGLSPWPDDFRVMNVPWEGRGKRLDECIEIIRGLSTGKWFEYHGEVFDLEPIQLCPAPTQPIPFLIGGHTEVIHALRREYGTDQKPFELHVISLDGFTVDGVRRLEDKGITDVIVGFRDAYKPDTMALQQKIDALKGYADRVIAKVKR